MSWNSNLFLGRIFYNRIKKLIFRVNKRKTHKNKKFYVNFFYKNYQKLNVRDLDQYIIHLIK